jgi:hypothetical protein
MPAASSAATPVSRSDDRLDSANGAPSSGGATTVAAGKDISRSANPTATRTGEGLVLRRRTVSARGKSARPRAPVQNGADASEWRDAAPKASRAAYARTRPSPTRPASRARPMTSNAAASVTASGIVRPGRGPGSTDSVWRSPIETVPSFSACRGAIPFPATGSHARQRFDRPRDRAKSGASAGRVRATQTSPESARGPTRAR